MPYRVIIAAELTPLEHNLLGYLFPVEAVRSPDRYPQMAGQIPVPRSYPQILGDQIDSFLRRYGIKGMKVGGSILSILESGAQSDLRNSQDIFNLLDADSLDRATGSALDRHAADEDMVRGAITPSSGTCTFSDISFTKISSSVYPGASAPNAGTSLLKVADASFFPLSGSVYLGRNTANYEGPIAYTSRTQVGSYWTIALSTPTQNFHDVNESVILAQGGSRVVPAGQTVQTPQGNLSTAATFITLYSANLPDGETEVDNVAVICQQGGVVGNVPLNSITVVVGQPFVGVAVTNPLPFDNGLPAEDDLSLRERIKQARASRAKGTPLALSTNAQGVTAKDENKTVLSASVVVGQENEPTIVFIDDGTGYEERDAGIASETLMDEAQGGEQYFQVSAPSPVARAFVKTGQSAPFPLESGQKLSVKVGGILSEHTFETSEFRSISNASAYEIVAAINGDSNLLFSARTADSGTTVVVFSQSNINEDVEIIVPAEGLNANTALQFPSGINYTLRLYKNDQLLSKDGSTAIVTSAIQSSWSNSIASGVELEIAVDGTPAVVYTFTDSDFIEAGTSYTTLAATNSLDAWAEVFNAKVPGITASAVDSNLILSSNRTNSSKGSVVLSQPESITNNLIALGMFVVGQTTANGHDRDYILNRNTGVVKLSASLSGGDSLTAGTSYPRAYIQGAAIPSTLVSLADTGILYLVVDGAAEVLNTGLSGAVSITITAPGNNRVRYTAGASNVFGTSDTGAYLQAGDWAIVWDPSLNAHGVWRISSVDTSTYAWFEVENDAATAQSVTNLTKGGLVFVRSSSPVQPIRIPAGSTQALPYIVDTINVQLIGATASIYRNTMLRITTNTYGSDGNICLVSANADGQALLMPIDELVTNVTSHIAALEAGNSELGTPLFSSIGNVTSMSTGLGFTATSSPLYAGYLIGWSRRAPGASWETEGANVGKYSTIYSIDNTGIITPRTVDSQYALGVGTMTRTSSSVVCTIAGGHEFAVGDSIRIWPGEADFAAGVFLLTSTNDTTVTYTQSGSATSNTTAQNIVLSQEILPNDKFFASVPYAIASDDTLNVVVNGDLVAKNYSLPMFRNIKPLMSATYGSTGFGVVDVDNANSALSIAFGSSNPDFFDDFAMFMNARGKSHAVGANKAILWRYGRMGADGNRVAISYTNPIAPSQGFALATLNGQYAQIQVSLPSGAARSSLSLQNTTRFTASISTSGSVDTVTYSYSDPTINSGGLSRTSSTVTATTSTVHGFSVGDVVYLTSTDSNFPAGAKTVVSVPTTSSFTYVESGTATTSGSSTTVSSASAAPTLGGLSVGDIVTISAGTQFPAAHQGSFRVSASTATSFTIKRPTGIVSAVTTPASIKSTTNIAFYPINAPTSAVVAAWINANANGLVTAVAVDNGGGSPGTGVIDTSTLDEYLLGTSNSSSGAVAFWSLTDGINFIQTSNLGVVPNTVTLKLAVSSDLTANADFNNERMRLVPITAATLAQYIDSSAVSGFYASSEVEAASKGGHLQLASTTQGSAGSIQVAGGTANAVNIGILGAGQTVDTNYSKITVLGAQAQGLTGNRYVAVQAANTMPKVSSWTSSDTMTIAAGTSPTNWLVTFTGSAVWDLKQTLYDTGPTADVRISPEGRFAAYRIDPSYTLTGSIAEGDWVVVQNLTGVSGANLGTFQIVRISSDRSTFWIENANALEEASVMTGSASGSFLFYSYDSAQPGDTFVIDTDAAGVQNQGSFTITSLHVADPQSFYVTGLLSAATLALTTTSALVRLVESTPARLIKRIHTIGRHPTNSDYLEIVFDTPDLASKMSATANSSIQSLDKLGFSTVTASGADAYSYATGLIGEVTRVLYGDQSNPAVYPGVVSAGANVGVSGPLIKRIQISLALRLRTGALPKDVMARVRSAVASVINKVKLTQSVDISAIISAARAVDGVAAVSVLSPAYGAGNDLIPVQTNEKPRILDINQDILLSIIG